jgi:hypothetical protein
MPGGGLGCGMSVLKIATSGIGEEMEAGTFGYPRVRSF